MSKKKARSRQVSPRSVSPAWHEVWYKLSDRTQHIVAFLILVTISFGFFAPIHFSSGSLIAGDTVQWRSMANAMIEYEQETGSPALWSPNSFGGMPGFMISYADQIPQLDAVPDELRSLIWPSSHFLVLLLGVYLLVWFLARDKLAAVFSAAAFGLTTYIPVILQAGHNSKFVALAWAPWLLLAFVFVLRKPSLLAGLLFATSAALNLRAGHVQITYYVVIIALIWWIVEGIKAHRTGLAGRFYRATGWLVLGSVLALLMVAQPYLAQLEYKRFTIRGAVSGGAAGGMDWSYAMAWSQGVGELLTVLVADAFGGGGGLYWGPKAFTAGPHYFGALTIALAIFAVARTRTATVWALAISGVLMVLFALGENFSLLNSPMFEYFPLFGTFRVPETWMIAVALVTAVLAGMGLAGIVSVSDRKGKSNPIDQRSLFAVFGAVAGLLLVLIIFQDSIFDFERPREDAMVFQQLRGQYPDILASDPRVQQVIREELVQRGDLRRDAFQKDARRSLLFLVLGFAILFLMYRRRLPPWLGVLGLVILVSLDLGGVGRRYINEGVLSRASGVEEEVQRFAFDDYILSQVDAAGGSGHFRVLSLEFGRDPSVNARPSYFYESLGGYHGAKLRVYQDYLDHILFDPITRALNPRALSMMNVRYVVGGRALPGYELAFQDDATRNSVFENPDVLPRAFFVGEVEQVDTAEEVWARLQSDSFDPSRTVLLMSKSPSESAPVDSTSVVDVGLVQFTPREIEWQLETDSDRWLVVSEVYYPAGWRAMIDGKEVEIEQANYLLRAVYVPAGSHVLRMEFDPGTHRAGVWLSGLSTLLVYGGLLALLIIAWRRRRNRGSDH